MNRPRHPIQLAGLAIAILAATFTLISCEDFFGAEDIKQIIKEDVDEATAESVTVTIQPASKTSMGTPSPINAQSFKVGLTYTISTTVGDDYTFLEWTHTGDEGDLTIDDPGASSTTFTVNRLVSGLTIQPTFDRRPYITIWDPFTGNLDYTNARTAITFNEPLDPTSLVLAENGSVQVTTNSYTDDLDPIEHIETRLELSTSPDGQKVIITPKSDSPFDPYHYVSITFTTEVRDLLGNPMSNDAYSFWKTNNGSDTQAPVISKFTITNTVGNESTSAATSWATNGNSIDLNITADDNQSVPYIKITEIPCIANGNPTGAPATITESSSFASGIPFPLILAATVDGFTKIEIEVADISKNWTTVTGDAIDTKVVQLDTVAPMGYSVNIAQTAVNNTNKDTIDFTITGAEVGAAYSFTFSSTGGGTDVTGSGTIASATQTVSDADLSGLADGTVTLSLTLTDTAGNPGSAVTDSLEK
ncbi:MAG: hypothetical protein AB7T74_11580, partial [Clostridia bacterium]